MEMVSGKYEDRYCEFLFLSDGLGCFQLPDSCGRGLSVVCQIWLLVVVLVVFANFRVVLEKVILLS